MWDGKKTNRWPVNVSEVQVLRVSNRDGKSFSGRQWRGVRFLAQCGHLADAQLVPPLNVTSGPFHRPPFSGRYGGHNFNEHFRASCFPCPRVYANGSSSSIHSKGQLATCQAELFLKQVHWTTVLIVNTCSTSRGQVDTTTCIKKTPTGGIQTT